MGKTARRVEFAVQQRCAEMEQHFNRKFGELNAKFDTLLNLLQQPKEHPAQPSAQTLANLEACKVWVTLLNKNSKKTYMGRFTQENWELFKNGEETTCYLSNSPILYQDRNHHLTFTLARILPEAWTSSSVIGTEQPEPAGLPALPTDFMKLTTPKEEEDSKEVIPARAHGELHEEAQTGFTYSVRELTFAEGYGKSYGRGGREMRYGVYRKDHAGAEVLLLRRNDKESATAEARRMANWKPNKQKAMKRLERY